MADFFMDVDVALTEVPVNIMPLLDATDFKTIEDAVAYNAAGLSLVWHFVTTAGVYNNGVAVTPTTGGAHDWTDHGTHGIYTIEIPASGGTINNDTEGYGWFTGVATGVLPWRGPTICFRAAALNNLFIDDANLFEDLFRLLVRADAGLATDAAAALARINLDRGSGAGTFDNTATPTVSVATGGITAASIATGAIDADDIAADAVTELQAGLATPADVNAQVLDVLNTDTFAEPTGVPAATNTLVSKISWLYMALRNKVTVTATKKTFFDDGDAAEWEKDISDSGTEYTESEANSV